MKKKRIRKSIRKKEATTSTAAQRRDRRRGGGERGQERRGRERGGGGRPAHERKERKRGGRDRKRRGGGRGRGGGMRDSCTLDMTHPATLTSSRSRFLLMISLLTSVSIIINIKFSQMQRRSITKMSRDQVYMRLSKSTETRAVYRMLHYEVIQ